MSDTSKIGISGLRTVSVPVTDQDRALAFYTGKLGFETRVDATFGEGQRWIEVAPAGSPTTIALTLPGPNESCGIDTGIHGRGYSIFFFCQFALGTIDQVFSGISQTGSFFFSNGQELLGLGLGFSQLPSRLFP